MDRRTLLVALGSMFSGGVVGYGLGDADRDEPTGRNTVKATTETPTPTPTPTATPTPTPRPTPTPIPFPTHEVGESFTVDDSKGGFRYVANGFFKAEAIGRFGGVEAKNGIFVGADLTVENLGGTERPVPLDDIILRGGVVKHVDAEMTNTLEEDPRTDLQSLADIVCYPGNTLRGAIVFDTPRDPSHDHRLHFRPPDAPESTPQVVHIGTLEEIDTLG